MNRSKHQPAPSYSRLVAASELHVCDVVEDGGVHRVVTSIRIQGAHPEVCVELTGLPGRRHYPTAVTITICQSSGHCRGKTDEGQLSLWPQRS